jgi:glycine/D-amino acid oxidase-like deaminating enzyme
LALVRSSDYRSGDYRARSFWLEQASASYSENAALEGMVRADVLIIGGGFTGVSTAYHLKKARPGLRVVLLESEVIGFGASGRNAGFAMTLFGLTLSLTTTRFGKQKALEAHRYMERAVGYVGELVRARNLQCDYEYPGFLRVATTPTYIRRIQAELELAHALGIEGVDWIEANELRTLVDSPTFLGAWREPHCALLNPARLVRELKRIAIAQGVEIYEHSPVTNLEFTQPIRAQTPHGAVETDKLLLATNAFSAQIAQLRTRQCPIHTYIVLTEPLNAAQMDSVKWRGRQGIEDARNLVHYYRLTPDNRLLMGGGDAHYFHNNQVGVDKHVPTFEQLQYFIAETFPGLRGIRITHRWGGAISATLDMAPAISYLGGDRRIIYSVGCMGHGVALSILNGQTISDLLNEQRSDLSEVFFVDRRVTPLPSEPFRTPLAQGIIGMLRTQDRFDERGGLGAM